MSSLLDAEIADAWGRWLEGEPGPTDEGVLAGGLRMATGTDDIAQLLAADESLDRLLRRSLAPPVASEAFVAGVLAAIDLPPLDAPSDVPQEPPLIRLRSPAARIRPRPMVGDGGLLAATIAGLGLAAAVIALAVIQPWNWRAPPRQRPAPAARRPEPKPEPAPGIDLPPEPAAKPVPAPPPEPAYPQPSYPQPDYPRPGSSRPDPDAASSGKAVEWTFGNATSGGTQPGGSSISISEQLINGRFRGTITIDGRTETFDSREAFEEAKRKLGR